METIPNQEKPEESGKGKVKKEKIFKVYFPIPFIIIAIGVVAAYFLFTTSPQPNKITPQKAVPQVRIEEIHLQKQMVTVTAMGTVIPARKLELKSKVSGEIVEIHPEFVDGGFIRKGEVLLQIDPADYELMVAQKKSKVVEARYALKLEMGHQEVAKREWELLNGGQKASDLDLELALRKPHLDKARADVAAAAAELKQARLDLNRTKISAPFNGIVLSKNVEKGTQVGVQESLAELVGTDEYWIQVSIPVDRLGWFDIPRRVKEKGAPVVIRSDSNSEIYGQVIKLLGDLEEEGRMARILVSVVDPLGLKKGGGDQKPLLIGQYVRVQIAGKELEKAARIPRSALRGGKLVWLVGEDGKLLTREVEVAWREEETLLIREGLKNGDRLVVTEMAAPEEGMLVQVISEPSAKISSGESGFGDRYGS